jgi:glycosyltransferase involved in cell wall biosynthesis
MSYSENRKIAIVHEWFDKYAGSERVVEQLLAIFPNADLFALVDFLPPGERSFIKDKTVKTTFIQRWPFARKKFRNYLAFFPMAIEQLDLRDYDIIISSSHAVAKGVLTNADQLHICYCHSPMRYAWDLYHPYLEEAGLKKGLRAFLAKWALHYLRLWDQSTTHRVNYFIANSNFVGRRIQNIYGRTYRLIYPPVDTMRFVPSPQRGDYYFVAARMVPYKKLDMIATAFRSMPDKKLIIVGNGPGLKKVKAVAGSNITIHTGLSGEQFLQFLTNAKAFVYAAEEDFGIVMAEAQSAGVPVIAYHKGGAAEIVHHGRTGILYPHQTEESLMEAVQQFEKTYFDAQVIREEAARFSIASFKQNFRDYTDACCREFFNLNP